MIKRPKDILRGDAITADYLNSLRDFGVKTLRPGPGISIHVTPGGHATISARREVHPRGGTTITSFWAKITDSEPMPGLLNQWKYAWVEQARTPDGWTQAASARSGTLSDGFAINSVEANNTGGEIEGNSIDLDGVIFSDNPDIELVAVRGEPVVRIYAEIDTDENACYTFSYENAIDGECA